jgi:SAM-dependent methyltransferase
MHKTAMENARRFLDHYGSNFVGGGASKIIEIGSKNVNGSIRQLVNDGFEYVGADFESGEGVDILVSDPYRLPFKDDEADIVMSSSCFEHSEMFWLLFIEALRILKPRGLFYLNVPSNGGYHRFPVDCWRFYPDSGRALVNWGRRMGFDCELMESFISNQDTDIWNDFVAVFIKDVSYAGDFEKRILDSYPDFHNGIKGRNAEILNFCGISEDEKKIYHLSTTLERLRSMVVRARTG